MTCQKPVPPFGMRCTGRSHGVREADGPSSEGLPSARAPARGVRAANDPVGWPPRGSLRRAHVGQRPKHRTKPADFDSQARAMRFIGAPRSEGARDERVRRDVSRPRFAQRACEREQHRTPGERDRLACVTHNMTAGVDHECVRRQQRFDLLEQEKSLLATRHQARSGAPSTSAVRAGIRAFVRGAGWRSPRPPARGQFSTQEGRARGRARRAYARPRRCARSGGGAGPRDTAHTRR